MLQRLASSFLVCLLFGCGSKAPKPAEPEPAPEPAGPESKSDRCSGYFDHVTELLLAQQPSENQQRMREAAARQRPVFIDACIKESTEQELSCGLAAKTPEELARCVAPERMAAGPECRRDDPFGPVILEEDKAATRHGTSATKFSELASSREKPAEVCAIAGSVALLRRLTCDDGSQPFANDEEAYATRDGSRGPGGRCQSVLDVYKVKCPEGEYEVWIDMYQCKAGEWPE
jgi:hypothetical protein